MYTDNKNYAVNYEIHFGMAAMTFLCNGVFPNQFNLPGVNLWFTLKLAKLHYFIFVDDLALLVKKIGVVFLCLYNTYNSYAFYSAILCNDIIACFHKLCYSSLIEKTLKTYMYLHKKLRCTCLYHESQLERFDRN